MKSKKIKRFFVFVLMVIVPCAIVLAQEEQQEKSDIFNITPAVAFSWYPHAEYKKEVSTNTDFDINNFGMSVIMGLKLFDKVGANLNLKIDDPTFQKMVDIAGYVTAYHFMIKFDYHAFGGTVKWAGNTPNPIPDGVYNFRNKWSNVSLLFRIDQLPIENIAIKAFLNNLYLWGSGNLAAVGIGYARFDMPLEYQTENNRIVNPGFGLISGDAWGFSILWDTLAKRMESGDGGVHIIPFLNYLWIYLDWFHGLIGTGETDGYAIEWMRDNNNGISVNGNFGNKVAYTIVKGALGFQYAWRVGKKGRIGIAAGVELLEETIEANNSDIGIYYWSQHIGPTIRVSARW
jgi:hypothetical protein